MFKPVDVIEVRIWDTTVGAIAADPSLGAYVFEYDSGWRRRGIELAPLTMPTSEAIHVFPALPEATYKRLPAMIADALPDDFGNALIDAWLAREGVAREAISALDRLAYMGQRGMGALEFKPTHGPKKRKPSVLKVSDLVSASRRALNERLDLEHAEAAIMQLIQVGTSAGGARAKAVVAWNPKTDEIRSGQLPAETGFEHWLLKIDGVGPDHELGEGGRYGRIEYAYHLMARAAGIDMADCRLFEENGRAHFMTRRFDRPGGEKLHVQSLCAMAHLDFRARATHDYAQLFQCVEQLALPDEARAEVFRRMVFNVLAANCDDHSKNFAFLMDRRGQWSLAPAYDVTHAFNPKGEWTYQHLMSVNGRFTGIDWNDFAQLGDRFLVPDYKGLYAKVKEAIASWPKYADKAGLPREHAQQIAGDFPPAG